MPIIHDQAIVLMRLDYSETSQVIVFFTREHGKVRAIGKGVKRGTKTRFAVGIDLLEIGNLVLSSRHENPTGLVPLTDWKQMRSLLGLREHLFRLDAALYAAELVAELTEDWDPHPDLFDALSDALVSLLDAESPLESTVMFQERLLHSIGLMPRFDACVRCGRKDHVTHFSSRDGGVLCGDCEPAQREKHRISART